MAEKKDEIKLKISWQKTRGVIFFADLANFFPLVRKMNLEDLGNFMSEFYGLLGSEIKHRKGEVISYIGDGVLGIFRREASAGMDPEWCAALAAFHLKKELKKVNSDLELNIGIHSGEVIEGRWEEQGRLMHSVFGDVVNRCALMGGGKLKGIHVTKAISEILGPRVSREKVSIRFPGCNEEEMVYKLTSLVL